MKRILSACLALMLLAAGCAAQAMELDFSAMSLEELYEARTALESAIVALEHPDGARYYEDGTYLVGTDLPEGDYALVEREDAMFASIVIRAGDSADAALVLHKLVSGQADVHLTRDTWVTLSELRAWPLGAEPGAVREDGSVGEGAYLVGVQLPAGRYTASLLEKAPLSSYSVFSGILGTDAQLMKFEILHEAVELTLEDGDYVELSGCALTRAEE